MKAKSRNNNFAYLLIFILIAFGDASAAMADNTDYYYTEDIKIADMPHWNPTNTIPLTPDKAVIAAMVYANKMAKSNKSWDVDEISLESNATRSDLWYYVIELVDRKSDENDVIIVRVLMNGEIWKPRSKPK
jgi:uncharacterized membrane protein YkoI